MDFAFLKCSFSLKEVFRMKGVFEQPLDKPKCDTYCFSDLFDQQIWQNVFFNDCSPSAYLGTEHLAIFFSFSVAR